MSAADAVRAFGRAAGWPLPAAASILADLGVPVFPCQPFGKRPLTRHGFLDATCDPERVRAWWRRFPEANIGVPTGPASGLDVVDVDARGGESGMPAFRAAAARCSAGRWAARVDTPSGGAHFYYPASLAAPASSWACAGARVDFRGAGGYVVVPPSVVAVAGVPRPYRLAETACHAAPVDAARLRRLLDPAWAQARLRGRVVPAAGGVDGDRLAAWVAGRPEGSRNGGLYWAARRMAEAGRDAAETLAVLGPAAAQAGLGDREINATVRSAHRPARPAPDAPAPARLRAPAERGAAARPGPQAVGW
ncbi:MAG: bifunctional DNA primase/polymerase [Bifidobacteriaceae bacterium]|nr:bifunctional DNA primase/polymerase [Bifidobacteriaceae bacterium]